MIHEFVFDVNLGAILGLAILGITCIIFFKTYPKEMNDLKKNDDIPVCRNTKCCCYSTCTSLGLRKRPETKPSGRKFWINH